MRTTGDALYTVSQVAAACGVSRSTLLRLEDEGLLVPTIHDTKRVYSFLDVMRLRQTIMLHNYGFTHAVIKEYFEDNGNYNNLIALIAAKQSDFFYFMREMQLRMNVQNDLQVQEIYAPDVLCHRMDWGDSFPYYSKHDELISRQMDEVIAKKYQISTSRPLFVTTDWKDLSKGADFSANRNFVGHIPLAEEPDTDDDSVVVVSPGKILSVLSYGPSLPMQRIINKLREKIENDHLTPNGPLYLISMVGPHLGLDIPPERYLARVALPVK